MVIHYNNSPCLKLIRYSITWAEKQTKNTIFFLVPEPNLLITAPALQRRHGSASTLSPGSGSVLREKIGSGSAQNTTGIAYIFSKEIIAILLPVVF